MKRTVIKINENLCNGCGDCVNGCHEGALQLINGKAVMVSDLYCDGLGACIGECKVGAIELEEREAEAYNEDLVMERIVSKGEKAILAHLSHLKNHGETILHQQGLEYLKRNNITINLDKEKPLACGCPSSTAISFCPSTNIGSNTSSSSELRQFPVQLHLLNPNADFIQSKVLLLASDCTAFACGAFHSNFLKGKALAIACSKLDSRTEVYVEKIVLMIDQSKINTLTVLIMEVPCCSGLLKIAQAAQHQAKRNIPLKLIVLSIKGEAIREEWL